jgi:hypothetical protein
VSRLLSRRPPESLLERFVDREHVILGPMAEGGSNAGARRVQVNEHMVEAASDHAFRRLDLDPGRDSNRRVLAVRPLLRNRGGAAPQWRIQPPDGRADQAPLCVKGSPDRTSLGSSAREVRTSPWSLARLEWCCHAWTQ